MLILLENQKNHIKSSNKSGTGGNWQRHPDLVSVGGVIGKPLESVIHTEIEETQDVDLEFCNVLANENSNFSEFIDHATNIYKTGKVY